MADYVDGVKIAELPEASSVSDTNILVTEDSDATKQVTADKLKDYTNAELLQRVTDLESQITQLNQSLTELDDDLTALDIISQTGTRLSDNSDLNNITDFGKYYCAAQATAQDFENCPVVSAFSMYVVRQVASSIVQWIFSQNENVVYYRLYRSSTVSWTAWQVIEATSV